MKIIIIYGHHYKIYNHKDLAPLVPNAVDHKAGEDGERLKHLQLSCFSCCCCCNNNKASEEMDEAKNYFVC